MKTFARAAAALLLGVLPGAAAAAEPAPAPAQPVVEVVFAVDTTGSMRGLIEGAKRKIWSIVNGIAAGKPTPIVRVGFVPYRDRGDAYVTRVHPLTDDLDKAFETLQTFAADGGGDTPEHVNKALHDAVYGMAWSADPKAYKVIFLVGDCPPHMDYNDGLDYRTICPQAAKRDLVINTVRCGNHAETEPPWREIARLAEGTYTSIDQSGGMVALATPFDRELADLAKEVTTTTVAAGGPEAKARKASDDRATEAYAAAPAATAPGAPPAAAPLAAAEKGAFYARSRQAFTGWDLVQMVIDGKVKADELKEEQLPDEMRKMTADERARYLEDKIARRKAVLAKIEEVSRRRDAFLKDEMKKREGAKDSFDAAVLRAVREQAAKKGIEYGK